MNDFKKTSFGRPSFGGGKPSFRGAPRKSFSSGERFQATCASCNKSCEVPFKPNGKKPVYCRDCFASSGGGESSASRGTSDRFAPRKDFSHAPAFVKPEYKAENSKEMAELKKQIEMIAAKLDKLIQALADKTLSEKQTEAKESAPDMEADLPAKKPAAKKKK